MTTGENNWRHVANEWADTATTALQMLLNIRDGLSTVDECIEHMSNFIERCRNLPVEEPAHAREAGAQEPVAWAYEFHEFGGVWKRWVILNRPDGGANPPTKHCGHDIRNLRPLYDHPAPAQEPVAVPAGELKERVAKLLWERFAPEHHVEWGDETHKAEYRSVADDVLSMLRACVAVAPTGWRLVPETATDEMIEAAWDSDAADYVGEHKRIHCLADAWKEMLAAAPVSPAADSGAVKDWIEAAVQSADVEWSYREDSAYPPRDFWHARCVLGDSDWTQYGGMEQRDLPDNVKAAAEIELREALRKTLSAIVPSTEPSPSQWNAGAEADKALADQREANLRARLDKIHSYASAIETLAKGGALPLPTPQAGEGAR